MLDLTTRAGVEEIVNSVRLRGQAFIDGKLVDARSGETYDNISPRDGVVLNQVASCDKADIDLAVAAARRTFEAGVWADMAPADRKAILLRFGELLTANGNELAVLETLDMGKPIKESIGFDVFALRECIQWYAEWCDKIYHEVAPSAPTALGLITREPVGVVGAVTPWNFPMVMAMWKVAPALATGNSVVLKPAEQSPLSAIRLAEIAIEAGLPAGVFNVVPGFGTTAGKALGMHMDVNTLVFTGSGEVGKYFLGYSAQSNMKRVWLECGGKTPNIILNDCPNVRKAAERAAGAIFYNQGEVCVAPSRLIVENGIRSEFMVELHDAAKGYVCSDPLEPDTQVGAIVDKVQMDRVLGYIETGKAEGAEVVMGGKQTLSNLGGYYIEPTIFDNVRNDMRIAQEEIFGPVLSVISADDENDALRIANDTTFGLAASLWTSDVSKAHRISRKLRAGSVWVNCFDGGGITMPFGGFKESGNGRDRSHHALDKYTETKSVWIEL